MESIIQIAGIDVSKDKLDVHILASNLDFSVSRDRRGLGELRRRLRKACVSDVALEASGDYERIVMEALEGDGFVVHQLNPAHVRHFGKAMGKLAKTDPIDARLTALYCRHFPEAGLGRRPEQARKLAEFLSVRAMLLSAIGEARNRLEHLREASLRALVEEDLARARAKLKTVDAAIAKVIAEDEALQRKADLVRSMIGAGPVLAATLLARVPELGSVDRQQAARLCGVAPADRRSGKSRRQARIDGGRDQLRPILYMVALTAIRSNPTIAAFAKRLTANGKSKRLVIAACSRKIITILNAMLRDQTPWQNSKLA